MGATRLALQISLDSATPDLHDQHRGRGTWERAVAGIRLAQAEGFRVRVAATLPYEENHQLGPFHTFLDSLGGPLRPRSSGRWPTAASPTRASS